MKTTKQAKTTMEMPKKLMMYASEGNLAYSFFMVKSVFSTIPVRAVPQASKKMPIPKNR